MAQKRASKRKNLQNVSGIKLEAFDQQVPLGELATGDRAGSPLSAANRRLALNSRLLAQLSGPWKQATGKLHSGKALAGS
jgi:hypothetical protein